MKKCTTHPKYKGKRIPKHECLGCLNFYIEMHRSPRAPIKPTRVMKDKTKYDRKKKVVE